MESIVPALAYGRRCSSAVDLRNLGDRAVVVEVEGHGASGALVSLAGSTGNTVRLAAGERVGEGAGASVVREACAGGRGQRIERVRGGQSIAHGGTGRGVSDAQPVVFAGGGGASWRSGLDDQIRRSGWRGRRCVTHRADSTRCRGGARDCSRSARRRSKCRCRHSGAWSFQWSAGEARNSR